MQIRCDIIWQLIRDILGFPHFAKICNWWGFRCTCPGLEAYAPEVSIDLLSMYNVIKNIRRVISKASFEKGSRSNSHNFTQKNNLLCTPDRSSEVFLKLQHFKNLLDYPEQRAVALPVHICLTSVNDCCFFLLLTHLPALGEQLSLILALFIFRGLDAALAHRNFVVPLPLTIRRSLKLSQSWNSNVITN